MPSVHEQVVQPSPASRLEVLETIFGQVKPAWVAGNEALREILHDELWKHASRKYKDEEDYLRRRWNLSKREAYYKLEMADIASAMGAENLADDSRESHMGALRGFDPDFQREIYETACQTAPGGKVTANWVEQTARRLDAARKAAVKEESENRKRQMEEAETEDDEEEGAEEEEEENQKPARQTSTSRTSQTIQAAAAHPINRREEIAKTWKRIARTIRKLDRECLKVSCTREDALEKFDRGELD